MIEEAAALLARAERVVAFTGAGMSAESGVPTFRDALTGLWERYDPARLATPEAFEADPGLVWAWYESRRAQVERAEPHPGHHAIARTAATVITQNVDDLHERAGSTDPVHLHGSLFAPRCSRCRKPAATPVGPPSDGERIAPPRCTACGAPIRPGVVWFGESLPETAFAAALDAASGCDLMLVVGTSAIVQPAAEIPHVAARRGTPVVQVNPRPTPLDPIATVNLHGPAAEILPALIGGTT